MEEIMIYNGLEVSELDLAGVSYLAVSDEEYKRRPAETDSDYVLRLQHIYNTATHWFCEEEDSLTKLDVGVIYSFLLDANDSGEFVVVDGNGMESFEWVRLAGKLLIKV